MYLHEGGGEAIFGRRRFLSAAGALGACVLAAPARGHAPERSPFPPPRPPLDGHGAGGAADARGTTAAAELIARANLGGRTGFAALDAETGEPLQLFEADLPLPPASVAKAPTALYALDRLGAGHRFVTRVLAAPKADAPLAADGVLNGDLILLGGGDPTLETADLATMADALVACGLRRITGRFVVDETALPALLAIDPDQPPQAGYNPGISGLCLNFNRVHFAWAVSDKSLSLSLDARSEREIPPVSVININAVERTEPAFSYTLTREGELWTVARASLRGQGSRWLPVHRPGLYAGDVFRALLAARGVRLPAPELGRLTGPGSVLVEHRSAPLDRILRDMLRYSTNLVAECCGLFASSVGTRRMPADLRASAENLNAWLTTALGTPGIALVDHSGLNPASRTTPLSFAQFFVAAFRDGRLLELLREHPMRDQAGRVQRDHPLSVRAKTGTLHFVSALGGYARMRSGRVIAFAIQSAALSRRAAIAPEARERPAGAQAWAGRARALQEALLELWTAHSG